MFCRFLMDHHHLTSKLLKSHAAVTEVQINWWDRPPQNASHILHSRMAAPFQCSHCLHLTFPFILPTASLLTSPAKAAPGSCTAPSLSRFSHSHSLSPFSPPSRSVLAVAGTLQSHSCTQTPTPTRSLHQKPQTDQLGTDTGWQNEEMTKTINVQQQSAARHNLFKASPSDLESPSSPGRLLD